MRQTLEEIIEAQGFLKKGFAKAKLWAGRHPAAVGLTTAAALYGFGLLSQVPHLETYRALDPLSLIAAAYIGYIGAKVAPKLLHSDYMQAQRKGVFKRLASHPWLVSASLTSPLLVQKLSKAVEYYREFSPLGFSYSLPGNIAGAVGHYASLALTAGLLCKFSSIFFTPSLMKSLKETFQIMKARASLKKLDGDLELKSTADQIRQRLQSGDHSAFAYHMHALLKFQLGEVDEGFLAYTEYFKNLKNTKNQIQAYDFYSVPMFHMIMKISDAAKRLWNPNSRPTIHGSLEGPVSSFSYFRNAEKVVSQLDRCIEEFPQKLELQTLKSLFLSSVGDMRANAEWKAAVAGFLSSPELLRESFGETVNAVYTLGPSEFFSKTLALKEHSSLSSLQKELQIKEHLDGVFRGHEAYSTVDVLLEPTPFEQANVLVMRYAPGSTFMERLETRGGEACLDLGKELARMTALMHAKSPQELSDKGRLKLILKAKSKLLSDELAAQLGDYARPIARELISNYRPVFESFQASIYGLNFDSHPEQFIISDHGTITRVDTEDKGVTPLQFDLVNLLEYGPYFTEAQKQEIIDEYIMQYNGHAPQKIIDKDHFMLLYRNAVVQRAISLCSAWSSTARRSMWRRRKEMLSAALNAIDQISQHNPEYYLEYEANYHGLGRALTKLQTLL
jgi:hypothetical protein